MKRFTKMTWAAVAVLGLFSPVSAFAGSPLGGLNSKGVSRVGNFGGSTSQSPSSNKSAGNFRSQNLGATNTQVFKKPGNFGQTTPIINLPNNTLPGKTKNPILNPLPGNIGPIVAGGQNGQGGKPKFPILTPFPGTGTGNGGAGGGKKPPFNPFPGGTIPPILDPGNGNGGGKKPPIFDPFPGGGIPPILDPGNGGGNNPPGGGNNPPGGGNNPPGNGGNNPPGGGNGGGNGNGGGCHHGGGKHCWPNYCLNWWWPTYYVQPYCGTVYVNGCWTYVTRPVAVEQISLVTVGDSLPEIPSNATFKMQVSGLGVTKGIAAVEINGVGMQAELLEWNADSVVVRLPAVGLTDAKVSELYILQSDGSMAKNLKFKITPALDTTVAAVK